MQRNSEALVWDALQAARAIQSYLGGVSLEVYLSDAMRRRAVEREFEIVGEALGRIRQHDGETAARIPGLHHAVGLRNVLIHGYAEIVDERVFDTAMQDLPGLVDALAALLGEASKP